MEEECRAREIQEDTACSNPCTDRGREELENRCGAQVEETAAMPARRRRMEFRRMKMASNVENVLGQDVSQMKRSRMPGGAIRSLRLREGEGEIQPADGAGKQDTADVKPPAGTRSDLNVSAAGSASIEDQQPLDTPSGGRQMSIINNPKAPDEQLRFDEALPERSISDCIGAAEAKDGASVHCPPHGFVSVIGRRREMEDAVAAVPRFFGRPSAAGELHFFGVYDGHGGSQASTFCKEYFHEALAEELRDRRGAEFSQDFWRKAMSACFAKVDSKVGGACPNGDSAGFCQETIAPENVGSTAVVAVVGASEIVIANCGDSRAVLSTAGKAVPLSRDHKPDREDERRRIEAAGGRVICWSGHRVGGLLALSRSIGDRYLKSYVISEPEVTCTERRDQDECLVLGSDGLWDVVSNDLACDVARKCLQRCKGAAADSPVAAAATLLTKLALARGSGDNISVLVVDLRDGRRMTSPPSTNP